MFALFVLAALPRLVGLGQVPPGPAFVESAMVSQAETLVNAPYQAHMTNGHTPYPSLVFYQGLGAAHWLGWKIASFRLPAALWGILSVLAFYFFLAQVVAPGTALLFAALFSVNNMHLGHSRLYYPGTIVYFAAAAGAALGMMALKRDRWQWYLLAGLAAGVSMHGYVPGRLVLPILGLWLAFASRRLWPVFWFGLGGLLMASPVLWWVANNQASYMGTVQHFGAGGPFASLIAYAKALPSYLAMPFTRPDGILDNSDGLALYPLLRADPLSLLLLPLGLGLACWRPRRHLSLLLLAGLFIGIVPAAVASGQPHPATRRALLALPFIYLAAAQAWDQIAAWLRPQSAGLRRLLGGLGFALALFGVAFSLRQYFVTIMQDPRLRRTCSASASIMARELEQHPDAAATLTYNLAAPHVAMLVYPRDTSRRRPSAPQNFRVLPLQRKTPTRYARVFEDHLVFPSEGEQLVLMDPFYRDARPLLERLYPKAQFKSWADPIRPAPPRGFPDGGHLQRLFVDAGSFADGRGMRDLHQAPWAAGSLVKTWDPAFGQAQRGRRLALGALLVLAEAEESWRIELPWPGWTLKVDGKAEPLNRALSLAQGSHALELSGQVPAQASGALPLQVVDAQGQALKLSELLALDPRLGFVAVARQEGLPPQRSVEPLPLRRYEAPEALRFPYQVEWSAYLKVPVSGSYQLRVPDGLHSSIEVASPAKVVTFADGGTLTQPFELKAGVATPLRLKFVVEEHLWREWSQNVVLEVKTPSGDDFEPLPFDWVWLR